MAFRRPTRFQKLSLGKKILLPFFLVLLFFGASATIVSVHLISQALSRTADQRLSAFETVAYRAIKKQESLMEACAGLIRSTSDFLGKDESDQVSHLLEDHLYQTLLTSNITVAFYPAASRHLFPYPEVRDLFEHVHRSGKPGFRFFSGPGIQAALAVAAPLSENDSGSQVVLLESPIDREFLTSLASPFNAHIYLLSTDGRTLLSDSSEPFGFPLTPEELRDVLSGKKIFRSRSAPFPYRYLVSAIPLGTTDVLVMGLELPMADLAILVKTLATGSVLAIFLALLLGGLVYYRLIRQIMAPIREFAASASAIGEGSLDRTVHYEGEDEFGELSKTFNNMLLRLRDLYERKVSQEKELALAQKELRYKRLLEGKNREIEKINREMKIHFRELSAFFQINKAMISSLDVGILFDRIAQVLKDVLKCNEMSLFLFNPGTEKLEARKAFGFPDDFLPGLVLDLDEGIVGRAASERKLIYEPQLSQEASAASYGGRAVLAGAAAAVPLVIKKRLKGVLTIHKTRIDSFSEMELSLIQAVANQLVIALENAQLYEQARNLSNTDDLTRLANRRHFQEVIQRELAQAQRYGDKFSLIMADIDHFKLYNDIHGHIRGDMVLKKVADILLQNTRGIDLVARFGGEEFVILLPKTNKAGGIIATEKLRRYIAEEKFPGEETSQPGGCLTLSLGVAEFPTDATDVFELLDLADRALYRAKEEGRNRVHVWQGT